MCVRVYVCACDWVQAYVYISVIMCVWGMGCVWVIYIFVSFSIHTFNLFLKNVFPVSILFEYFIIFTNVYSFVSIRFFKN